MKKKETPLHVYDFRVQRWATNHRVRPTSKACVLPRLQIHPPTTQSLYIPKRAGVHPHYYWIPYGWYTSEERNRNVSRFLHLPTKSTWTPSRQTPLMIVSYRFPEENSTKRGFSRPYPSRCLKRRALRDAHPSSAALTPVAGFTSDWEKMWNAALLL